MAFDVGSIYASIGVKYDSKGLKDFDQDMDKAGRSINDLDKKTGKLSSSLKSGLKVGAAAASTAIGAGLALSLKQAVAEARDAQKTTKQTEAVIKSTGGAANVTAKQVGSLAEAISNKIGVDDEAIQASSNLLLTFKNIQNSADGQTKTFDRTTMAVADMAAAMTRAAPTADSMKSSAIMLGKAMNDPIKGISAMARVGIQFTESQKAQIEKLVETGNLQKAQAIILKEVESQFKGSAKAQTDAITRLKTVWDNFLETIGLKLLPVINKAANWLSRFIKQFSAGKGEGGKFRETLENVWKVLKNLWPTIETIGKSVGKLIGWFSNLSPEVQKTALAIGTLLIVGTKFVKFLRLAPMMAGPWGIALTALAIAAVAIISNWDKIKPFLKKLFNWLKSTFEDVADKVKSAAKKGFLGPAVWIIANWGKVKTFFRDLPGKIGSFLGGIGSKLISPFRSAFNTVRDIFNRMVRFIRGAIGKIKGAVSDVGGFIGDGLGALGNVVGLAEGGVVGPGAGGPQLFLAGEGNAKEYVISTEGPRNKNVGYLKEAASALGIPMFAQGGKVQDRINQKITNLQTKMDLKRREYEMSGGSISSKEYDRLIGINQMIESNLKELIGVTKGQARRDARFALRTAQLDRRDLVKSRNTATGEASAATTDLDFQIQGLETQLQLAEAGYGGDAGALRTKIKSKLQKKLKTLRDRLSGTNNREQIMMLNDAIQGTLGQLSSYASGESGASIIEQTAAASQLRYSALAQFGGNAFQSRLGSPLAASGQTVVNLNGEFKLDSNDPHGSVRELGYQIATNLN